MRPGGQDVSPEAAAARLQQLHRVAREAARNGQHDEAFALLSEAASLAPEDASICCDLGRLLAQRGELEASLPWFERAGVLQPARLEIRFFLGLTLLRLGRAAEGIPHLRHAARVAPEDPAVCAALAEGEFHAGNDAEALLALETAVRLKPGDEDLLLKLGEVMTRLGRHESALAHFREASGRWPAFAGLWMAFAQACEESGNAEDAEVAYRRALVLRPQWAQPLAGLLGLRRGAASEADIDAAEGLLAVGALADADVGVLGYPLGRVHDARKAHARAFESWRLANGAREREVGAMDIASFEADVDHQLRLPVAEHRGLASGGEALVFVVGMPRSGTTLVEQVLDAHPDAAGCGELPFFAELVARLPEPNGMDEATAALEASRYLAIARRHGAAGALRLVDKAPLNALHLGHVARLFPSARIVWCRRDARDVGLSIFSENFAKSARFASSLESIAACINAQHRLMRHWQRVSGLRILEACYETLVDDFEAEVRRIVEFCGLPWDDACLDFHRRTRVVQTPSRWQVRQPVHRGSVGRWRNHAENLAPLMERLRVPVEADGVPRS